MALRLLILAELVVLVKSCSCPPGTYLGAPPCDCILCPNDTYTDSYNNATSCKPCRTTCERPKIIIKQCTRKEDSKCGCPAGQYFHAGLLFCMKCDICLPGQGTDIKCSTDSNTACKPCIPGKTFSTSNSMSSCENCSVCRAGYEVKNLCNATRDTICEPIVYNFTTQKTFTRDFTDVSPTNKSRFQNTSKQNTDLVPILVAIFVFIAIILAAIIVCFLYRKRRRGVEQRINFDSEERAECEEVIQLEPKPVATRHSGLRGRHTRQPRRSDTRRNPLDSDGSSESDPLHLPNGDKLLREVPYCVIEKLALKLNPKGLNNWVTLAGQLKYSKEKVDYFGMEKENATQRMLSDWQTSNSSTVGVLHRHLKSIYRDDAAEVLETLA